MFQKDFEILISWILEPQLSFYIFYIKDLEDLSEYSDVELQMCS